MVLAGCKSNDTQYIERVVEVPINTPSALKHECDIPKRDGNKVVDYIVSEQRLYNSLIMCNNVIQERNKFEQSVIDNINKKNGDKK